MNKSLQKLLSNVLAFVMVITSVFSSTVLTFADENATITNATSTNIDVALADNQASDIKNVVDKRGDFDQNGSIEANDASLALTYVLNKASYLGDLSSDEIEEILDVNDDNIISSNDVAEILQKAITPDFNFSGDYKKPTSSETTSSKVESTSEMTTSTTESTTETTTEDSKETTTESTTETTTEGSVDSNPQDAIYEGYDIVVDARVNTDAKREGQPIFKTVREAISAAGAGGTEDDPVVIGIVPGVYREHIAIDVPYITLKKITNSTSEAEDATLTWYYMTGYTYDSIGSDGMAVTDGSRPNASGANTGKMPNWGRSTWIKKGATGFRAEGIYFENSANLYMCQEELDDNVRPTDTKPERKNVPVGYGTSYGNGGDGDVRTRYYRERCCALYTEADKVVFENCKVIATQDTLGTDGRAYFKNCLVAGTVDFICGGGQILFDECDIHWQSSPYMQDTNDFGGPLTAAHTGEGLNGYLFYNCKVTGEDTTTSCNLGRPWSGELAETVWVNTVADVSRNSTALGVPMISKEAWGGMSSDPEVARYFEYNSTDVNGNELTKANQASRRGYTGGQFDGGVLDEFTVVRYNPYRYTAFNYNTKAYDGWDPAGVVEKWTEIEAKADSMKLEESYDADFVLPEAPEGYEVKYYIESNFVSIGNDNRTVTVSRPLFGQPDETVKFTAYVKQAGTIDGKEIELSTVIKARTDSAGTFATKGDIKLTFVQDKDVTVDLSFDMASGWHAADKQVVIPAGSKSASYEVPNLPAAEYNITITHDNDLLAVVGGDVKNITGEANVDYPLDIQLGALETVSKTASDIVGTTPDGYTLEKFADAAKGDAYYFKRASSAKDTTTYYYFDLATLADDVEELKAADEIRVNFSMKVPQIQNDDYKYIDLIATDAKAFGGSKDDARYFRMKVNASWNQIDIIDGQVGGYSGASNNEHQKLNLFEGAGKFKPGGSNEGWNDVEVTIDQKHGKVLIYSPQGKAANMPFTFDLPTGADVSKLKLMFYPQGTKSVETDEMYFTIPTLEYERFIPEEDTSNVVTVSGTAKGVTDVKLINKEQPLFTYTATIGDDGALTFDKQVPVATYEVNYTLDGTSKFKDITGTGITKENDKYYLTLSTGVNVTDFSVIAEAVSGFADAETALINYINSTFEKDENSVYSVNKGIIIPKVDGYTIEIVPNENGSITADGTLNRKDFDTVDAAEKLTFKITNNADQSNENFEFDVLVASKCANVYQRDFEEMKTGSTIEAGNPKADGTGVADVVEVGAMGNVLKFSCANADYIDVASFETADNGVYSVKYDIMRDSVSGNGWKQLFGGKFGLNWDGTKNAQFEAGGTYDSTSIYGTSSSLPTTDANEWYNVELIFNNSTNHIDAYLDNEYVTSFKATEAGKLNGLRLYTYYSPAGYVYIDNIEVNRLDENFKEEFETAMTGIEVPATVGAEEVVLDLPTKTEMDFNIEWICDKNSNVVAIDGGKVTLKPQASATTAVLKGIVTNQNLSDYYKGCQNEGVVDTISYIFEKEIGFEQNATETFKLYGSIDSNIALSQNVEIAVEIIQDNEVKGSTTATISNGSKTTNYEIENVVPGDYEVNAYVVTEGTKVVVSGYDKTVTISDDKTLNISIGELETKTYTLDFDNVELIATELGSSDSNFTYTVSEADGNKYLDMNATASSSKGIGYDLYNLVPENRLETLKTTDKVTVSYKIKALSWSGYTDNSWFGLASGFDTSSGSNESRYVVVNAGRWNQPNITDKTGSQIYGVGSGNQPNTNGDPTSSCLKFGGADNAPAIDRWYTVTFVIDYENKNITGTITTPDGADGNEVVAKFMLDENGNNLDYETYKFGNNEGIYPCIDSSMFPTNYDRNSLNFSYYPVRASQFYLDDLSISFEDFKTEEGDSVVALENYIEDDADVELSEEIELAEEIETIKDENVETTTEDIALENNEEVTEDNEVIEDTEDNEVTEEVTENNEVIEDIEVNEVTEDVEDTAEIVEEVIEDTAEETIEVVEEAVEEIA